MGGARPRRAPRHAFASDLADSAFAYKDLRLGPDTTRSLLRRLCRVVGGLRFEPADPRRSGRFAASLSGTVDGQRVQVPLDPGQVRAVRAILEPVLRAAAGAGWTHDPSRSTRASPAGGH